jgi:hypothetical protein
MWRIVRFEDDVSTSVCGFSVNFGGQYRPFPDDQNTQKKKHTDFISIVNWAEGLKLLRRLKKFCNHSGP